MKLNMSQSAISKRIQELEDAFDMPIFDRSKRSARLTEKGTELFEQATEILRQRDYLLGVAALIFLIYTIVAADRANLGVALPFIRKEFEMSNAEAGGLMSLFLLAYALAQLPSGFAFGRFGVSRILPGAMVLTSRIGAGLPHPAMQVLITTKGEHPPL